MSAANPEQLYCCHTPRFNNFKNWSSHRYTSCQHPSRHCSETQTTRAAAVQGQLAAKGRAKCKSEESAWGSSLGGRWVSVSSCCCDKYLSKSHRGRKGLFWSQIQVTVYHCGEVKRPSTSTVPSLLRIMHARFLCTAHFLRSWTVQTCCHPHKIIYSILGTWNTSWFIKNI